MASIISAGTTSGTSLNLSGDTSGVLQLASNGSTTAVTIDTSQNVGIGTASPTRKLHISASGSACAIRIDNTVSGRPTLLAYDDSQNLTLINSSDTGYFAYNNGTGASTERMRIDSSGNLLFNSGYGSVATAYGCRAWVNFDGTANTNLTGTYSQTGTTVTVTITAHGYVTGSIAYLDFTSGTAVDGDYTVTVTDANTFTVTQASRTTSGNVTSRRHTIRGSGNVSSITDSGTGFYVVNFTNALPDTNYSVTGSTNGGGGRDTNFIVALTPSSTAGTYSTTAVQVLSYDIGAAAAVDSSIVSVVVFR